MKNKKKRDLYYKVRNKKIILNSIQRNRLIKIRYNYYNYYDEFFSISSINYMCLLTNRIYGNRSKFRLSRIKFKELVGQGTLPGISKSSW